MTTEIYFKGIKEQIINLVRAAQSDIKIAMAWLTDEDIIREITKKKQSGAEVTIAISNSIENFRRVDKFKSFLKADGSLFISQETFLHHKFCLIDNTVFINGSYNWSYTAQHNEENIMVHKLDKNIPDDGKLVQKINAKYNYLCDKICKRILSFQELASYTSSSLNYSSILIMADEAEIALRQAFEDHVERSINTSRAEGISSNYDRLMDRMQSDGGGVYFVKRILREEMINSEMKTGFNKLVQCIPHRVDLSLEYLVCQPQYRSLFSAEEVEFCLRLMTKYNLVSS